MFWTMFFASLLALVVSPLIKMMLLGLYSRIFKKSIKLEGIKYEAIYEEQIDE